MIDFEPILQRIREAAKRHTVSTGACSRFTISTDKAVRDTGVSPYGCSDTADILYIPGDFPFNPEERTATIKTLQNFQNP